MELQIRGKVSIVTGASDGIGQAIATGLAKEGARVAICGRRKAELEIAAETIKRTSGNDQVIAIDGDMTHEDDVERFINAVFGEWKTVDILVNNVGRATRAEFARLSMDDFGSAFGANLYSSIYCARKVLPYMKSQSWGRIVNISSISGKEPTAGSMASNIAKSSVISFTKSLAAEVARYGILVNCVCPGRIITGQTSRMLTSEERNRIASQIPLLRFGTPEEVAAVVLFLSSQCASYITGTAILVDGGMSHAL